MLDLRPNCELCDRDLPPDTKDAMICSHECTYCVDCVNGPLQNVCPTCGGGFCPRPIRPKRNWREGKTLGLENQPASTKRINSPYSREDIAAHVARIKHLKPEER